MIVATDEMMKRKRSTAGTGRSERTGNASAGQPLSHSSGRRLATEADLRRLGWGRDKAGAATAWWLYRPAFPQRFTPNILLAVLTKRLLSASSTFSGVNCGSMPSNLQVASTCSTTNFGWK